MVRKNILLLTPSELDAFISALQAMKSSGTYDEFTKRHFQAMMTPTLMSGETTADTQRNVAHSGPSFGPWHRQVILEFENALGVPLPYWAWQDEAADWWSAPIWGIIGGNGDPNARPRWRVVDGPFSGWDSVIWNVNAQSFVARAGIRRDFSTGPLPTAAQVSRFSRLAPYDLAPWNEFSSLSFRVELERRHNLVHNRIGGDMKAGTAPNDPVFWLHHSNIDRIWAERQETYGLRNYEPEAGGPPGHNLNDAMTHVVTANVRPADVLDFRALGYSYDTLEG